MHFLKLPKINNARIRQLYYIPESIVVHPAKMSLALCNWILDNYVNAGDIVLDPLAGIFTTGIEGMRKYPSCIFIGVELEKKFCDLANANIRKTEDYMAGDLFNLKFGKAFIIQGDARNLPLRNADTIVTSPSYGGVEIVVDGELSKWQNKQQRARTMEETYRSDGNLAMMEYGEYLPEMMKVYAQCNLVLKLGGLMALVCKNFVHDGIQVRLDEDTIRLCQVCGFELVERHYRKLYSESFWRIFYKKHWEEDHPDEPCPIPQWEDILVFKKVVNEPLPF